jgi:RHS repeat-associated protein
VPITLSDGTHVITATVSDQWGQVSPPGAAGLITVDTVSPTVTIQELAPYQDQITVTLRWDGNDPPPGTGVLNYDLKHQFGSAGSWLTLQYGTPLTEWVYTAGQEGIHNFRVLARDRAFNSSAWADTGTIVDVTEPEVLLTLAASQPYGYAVTDSIYYGQGSGDFTVTAAMTDAISGLAQVIFPDTTDAGATYGLGGAIAAARSHPYAFDSNDTFSATLAITATDRAGNQTTQPFTLFKDSISPTVTIAVPPVAPLHFRVSWLGQDGESGLRDYDVQYKVGISGTWTSWLSDTTQTQADFVGERDQSYYFRVQATDHVNNASAWVEAGPVTVSAVTKYYMFGDQRIAMRQGDVVYFIHADHLGSTSLTTDITGTVVAETRYLPYGEERWTSGGAVTDFTFTGQRAERGFALMDYNARYYDPGLGRFISADRVVPEAGNPQTLNRYAYAGNSPVRYTDPSGHCTPEECPWALTQKLWDRYGPATGAARYRLAAAALAAIKEDEAIARANAGGGDLAGLKAAINLDMSNYLLKEGIREYEPKSWTYALEAGATGGLLTAGALNSGADNSVPFSPSQQRDIIGDPGPTGVASRASRSPDFVVTEDGVAIPTDRRTLNNALSNLTETSTNPATSRKFVGADSKGSLRVRIEKAHPSDPDFTGVPDPLHTVDHLHIDRRRNVDTGSWYSKEKTQYDWPFD